MQEFLDRTNEFLEPRSRFFLLLSLLFSRTVDAAPQVLEFGTRPLIPRGTENFVWTLLTPPDHHVEPPFLTFPPYVKKSQLL